MVLFGPPGVGKTSTAAHFPKPGFIYDSHETGIEYLVKHKQCPEPQWKQPVSDWSTLIHTIRQAALDNTIETLVLDSLTGFEQYCFTHCCEIDYDNDWSSKGFYSYYQGPATAASRYWEPEFISACNDVSLSGKAVIVLAHSQIKKYEDPMSTGWDQFQPVLHGKLWAMTHRWAKSVIFMNYFTALVQPDGSTRKKPDSRLADARNFYTVHNPAVAGVKNCFGLEPIIDCGSSPQEAYNNLLEAFQETQ
jgi:hypothetical protein